MWQQNLSLVGAKRGARLRRYQPCNSARGIGITTLSCLCLYNQLNTRSLQPWNSMPSDQHISHQLQIYSPMPLPCPVSWRTPYPISPAVGLAMHCMVRGTHHRRVMLTGLSIVGSSLETSTASDCPLPCHGICTTRQLLHGGLQP